MCTSLDQSVFPARWCADHSKTYGFLAGGISESLSSFSSRLRRLLVITFFRVRLQYRQLRRLGIRCLVLFVAQCTLVEGAMHSGKKPQSILVKSDDFENSFSLLYILLKSCLCCCSLATFAPQQQDNQEQFTTEQEMVDMRVLGFQPRARYESKTINSIIQIVTLRDIHTI